MTKAGKIKTLILGLFAIANLALYTSPVSKTEITYLALSGFLTGFIGGLLKSVRNVAISKQRYQRPSWNDKFFRSGNVLSNYLFVSMFFIIIGLCIVIKTVIIYGGISLPGAISLSFGLGILIATYLSFIFFRSGLNLK